MPGASGSSSALLLSPPTQVKTSQTSQRPPYISGDSSTFGGAGQGGSTGPPNEVESGYRIFQCTIPEPFKGQVGWWPSYLPCQNKQALCSHFPCVS